MRQSLTLLFLAFFVSNFSAAQNSELCEIGLFTTRGGINFQLTGAESKPFVDSLFVHFSGVKRKRYVWKFKKVQVPGISDPITFQVHQGIRGYYGKQKCDTNSCGGGSYFHTFTSEKYKQELLDKQTESEYPGVIIYVKRGRKYGAKTRDEADLVKVYLRSIYGG